MDPEPSIPTGLTKEMYQDALSLMELFLTIANNLDLHYKKVNLARVIGSSVAVVGGGLATAGGIAMFFTMGASVVIAIVGGGVAAAGTAVSSGAVIFRFIIQKSKLKKAETMWAKFCESYKMRLREDEMRGPEAPAGAAAGLAGAGMTGVTLTAREMVTVGAQAGGRVATTAARLGTAIASATVFANVALMGFSIYDIIDGSLEIHRLKKSPAGDILRRLASDLKKMTEGVDRKLLDDDISLLND